MTKIVTILTEGFADWETTLLNGVAKGYYKAETHYASPGGRPVTSTGGMNVTPDLRLEDVDVADYGAVVVCGGNAWLQPNPPDLTRLLTAAKAQGKVIGAICDGTIAAARTGILDDVDHTSNGAGYLDRTDYRGKSHYRDVPSAVSDHNIVTASATAPVSFMAEVMRGLKLGDEQLDQYVVRHARQFTPEP